MMRRGLTLLELTVALTVTATAAAAGWGALATLVDHRRRAHEATAEVERAAAVRRALVAWLEGAHAPAEGAGPPFELTDRSFRGRPDDELQLLTSAGTPLGEGAVGVRLFVDRDHRTPERGLTAEFTDRGRGRITRLELDSSVVALEVRCLTDLLGRREWMRSWLSGVVLPRGIELRPAAAEPERLTPLLRLPLLVVVEGGR
ncbi:MAG TPA: prepilin-type N-terminal cleavage/methylation domain-containing protein [Gemmatimonadaceae bacterium]